MKRPSRSIPPILCGIDADGLAEASRILRAGIETLSDRDALRGYDLLDNRVTGMSITGERNGWEVRVLTGRTTSVSMSMQGSGRSMDFDFDEHIVAYDDVLDGMEQGSARRIKTALAILERIPVQSRSRLERASAIMDETARAIAAHAGANGHPNASVTLVAPSSVAPGRCDVHSRPPFHSPEVVEWALTRTKPLLHAFVDDAGGMRRYRLRRASVNKDVGGPLDVIRDLVLLPEELRP